MNKLFRIIDANINRASEGIRVLEDISRFYYDSKPMSEKLKVLRHNIRKNIPSFASVCLKERDSRADVGIDISKELKIDQKSNINDVICANFKRLEEALRSIEETLRLMQNYELSKIYEMFRFEAYTLEKEYSDLEGAVKKRKMLNTDLYCITAEQYSKGRSNIEVVRELINNGIKIIQYREKEKKQLEKYNECLEIRKLTAEAGVTFIVNDDIDIAMMVKADGVHIGQDDLPVKKVRELVGKDMIIGVSTHSKEQAEAAVQNDADYIGVGPIYKTYTKKDVCEPVGLTYLEYVAANLDVPFVAIGGIKEHNVLEVQSKGAKCISMVTEIVGAEGIGEKILKIRKILRGK